MVKSSMSIFQKMLGEQELQNSIPIILRMKTLNYLLLILISLSCSTPDHNSTSITSSDSLSIELNNSAMDHFHDFVFGRNESIDSLEIALSKLDQAIELSPSSLQLYANKSNILLRLQRIDGAIEVLKKAIEVDPNSAEILTTIGLLWEQKGNTIIAQEWLQRAQAAYDKRIHDDNHVINSKVNKAFLLFFMENEQSANKALDELLQEYPNNDEVIFSKEVLSDFNKQEFLNNLTYN